MDEKEIIIKKIYNLVRLYEKGELGGDFMPEDSNPALQKDSEENYIYFTLPMALNYQRDSYKLWESARLTFLDESTCDVFLPNAVIKMDFNVLQEKLVKHKLALQKNRHIEIWAALCKTFCSISEGSIKNFLQGNNYNVGLIKKYMEENKKLFPYLSGAKISNYWLYVLESYTDAVFTDRENITVAPDTHVIQASVKLGVIDEDICKNPKCREMVSSAWEEILKGSKYVPIDVHTALWLWSRGGFKINLEQIE